MTKMNEFRRQKNFVSVLVVVVLALLMVMPVGSISAWPMHENIVNQPVEFDPDTMGNITLNDISAPPYFRVAFTDKDNQLKLDMDNNGEFPAVVQVDLYSVQPDGVTRTFLKTVNFGAIPGGHEKSRNAFLPWEDMWQPSERGRNWIRGEIYVKWLHNERINVGNFTESFNVVPGWRPVTYIPHDWVIDEPLVVENRTIIVDGDVYVNAPTVMNNGTLAAGNFTVSNSQTIGANFDVDLLCSKDGEFKAEVKPSGTLNVYGKIWNNPQDAHYWFYMNGTLNVTKDPYAETPGVIENVYGPDDLSQPGGVICTTDNVYIGNGAEIRNGRTHGLYLMNGSKALINNAYIHDNGYGIGGDGIVCVDGASPTITGNTEVSWNGRHGIMGDGALPNIDNILVENNYADGIVVQNAIGAYGKPVYTPGVDLGYFIWWDENGWHLRYSSDSEDHYFNGTITADSGTRTFGLTVSAGTEQQDNIGDYPTVTLDLWLDGVKQPSLVYFGSESSNPASLPVTLYNGAGGKIAGNAIRSNFVSGLVLKDTNILVESNIITSNGQHLVFVDDFESPNSTWYGTGLWHVVDSSPANAPGWNISHSGERSYWYGINDTGTYNTSGTANSGTLSSPWIDISNARAATLSFWSYFETEDVRTGVDTRSVTVHANSTPDQTFVLAGNNGTWERIVLNISDFSGKVISLTFTFDTVDEFNNDYLGWYIDDVEVITMSSPPPYVGNGIYCLGDVSSRISNNTIADNNLNGISSFRAQNMRIVSNNISDNHYHAISLITSDYTEIYGNNIFDNNGAGVYIYYDQVTHHNKIIENNIVGNRNRGIYLSYAKGTYVEGNNISENGKDGIYVYYSSGVSMVQNEIGHQYGTYFPSKGIAIKQSLNNIISGNEVYSNSMGVWVYSALNTQIKDNIFSSNYDGIVSYMSSESSIQNNTLSSRRTGIDLYHSIFSEIADNTMAGCSLFIRGTSLDHWNTHVIDVSNTVNAKPVYYWKNQTGGTLPTDAGEVILANCSDVVVEHQDIGNGTVGIELGFSDNSSVYYNDLKYNEFGVYAYKMEFCSITNTTLFSNENADISIVASRRNVIKFNNISHERTPALLERCNHGVIMRDSSNNNTIFGNSIEHTYKAVCLGKSATYNNISHNQLSFNQVGIDFWEFRHAFRNVVFSNDISHNTYGILSDDYSERNLIISNNISYSVEGITIDNGRSNTYIKNKISQSISGGIVMGDAYNESLLDNEITSSGAYGIRIVRCKSILVESNNISNSGAAGVYFSAGQSLTIKRNLLLTNGEYGIYAMNGHVDIIENKMSGNRVGIHLSQTWGGSTAIGNILFNNSGGIELYAVDHNLLSDNTIFNNSQYGFYISGSDDNLILDNTISNNTQRGIYLSDASYLNHIEGNNITWNRYGGISLDRASHSNFILNNSISHNQGGKGICSNNASGTTIKGNYISDNNRGIHLFNSDAIISANNITQNYYAGVYIDNSLSEIYNNTITDNNADVYSPGIDTGIHIVNSNDVWVHDNILIWNTVGVYVLNSTNITIEHNIIAEGPVQTINGWAVPTVGIHSVSSQVVITRNIIYGSTYAIEIENAGNDTVVANNTLIPLYPDPLGAAEIGIYLINASAVVENNSINANTGISVTESSGATIRGNTITTTSGDGIRVENSTSVIVEYNNASECAGSGLYVYHAELLIDGNNFWGNSIGIFITGGSTATLSYNTALYNLIWDIYIKGQNDVTIEGNNTYTTLKIEP